MGVDVSCVYACACVENNDQKILYILGVPFRVGGVRDYIYKKTKAKSCPVVLDLNCWKRVVCALFYICAVNIKSYRLWDFY